MKNLFKNSFSALLLFAMVLTSCEKEEALKNDNQIISSIEFEHTSLIYKGEKYTKNEVENSKKLQDLAEKSEFFFINETADESKSLSQSDLYIYDTHNEYIEHQKILEKKFKAEDKAYEEKIANDTKRGRGSRIAIEFYDRVRLRNRIYRRVETLGRGTYQRYYGKRLRYRIESVAFRSGGATTLLRLAIKGNRHWDSSTCCRILNSTQSLGKFRNQNGDQYKLVVRR